MCAANVLPLSLLALVLVACDALAVPLRVGSFNILTSSNSDHPWNERRESVVLRLKALDLDVFGLQEVTKTQRSYLVSKLSDYAFVGDSRESDRTSGEYVPVAYRTSLFVREKYGTFWLSTTPDTAGSKSWDTSCPRICTYALLRDRRTGRRFVFANAHLDHRSEAARVNGAKLVIERLKNLGENIPSILVGDHNCYEDDTAAEALRCAYDDSLYVTVAPPEGSWRTFNSLRWMSPEVSVEEALRLAPSVRNTSAYISTCKGSRIDFIYVTPGTTVLDYRVDNSRRGELNTYPSDHFPVVTTLEYEPGGTVRFPSAATVGADFASVTVPVSTRIAQLGFDHSRAVLTVTLSRNGTTCATRRVALAECGERTQSVTFGGIEPGHTYCLRATLACGETTLDEATQTFTSARETPRGTETTELPPWSSRDVSSFVDYVPTSGVMMAREVLLNVRIDGIGNLSDLGAPEGARAGFAAVASEDGVGVFAYWNGTSWIRTSVPVLAGSDQWLSMIFGDTTVTYGVWREGVRVELGSGTLPAGRSQGFFRFYGAANLNAVDAGDADANLLATADGSVEYATFASALAAQEMRPLVPLWEMTGTVPANVRLAVVSLLDPDGLLTLKGNLLAEKVLKDGSVLRAYGTMDAQQVAASDYLKATVKLGLDQPLMNTSRVTLDDVTLGIVEGTSSFGFGVYVDGVPVAAERAVDYLWTAEDLAAGVWRKPSAGEFGLRDGKLAVTPVGAPNRAFVRIVLPKD